MVHPLLKTVGSLCERVVPRDLTLPQLKSRLAEMFREPLETWRQAAGLSEPEISSLPASAPDVIELAKGSTFGPALTIATAPKLKWNQMEAGVDSTITASPMSLRDGSILYIQSHSERLAACSSDTGCPDTVERARKARARPLHARGPSAPVGAGIRYVPGARVARVARPAGTIAAGGQPPSRS